ncbi:hypothetical protein HYY74_02395 [Candidatus Woesearchaeota archaeon]|nr:hypothetical protein [Candidatus Woesearchaeota archaeon]
MKYEATIKTTDEAELIFKAFEPEGMKSDRSSYQVSMEGDSVLFRISAADATALRAALSSISKALAVIEKTGEI